MAIASPTHFIKASRKMCQLLHLFCCPDLVTSHILQLLERTISLNACFQSGLRETVTDLCFTTCRKWVFRWCRSLYMACLMRALMRSTTFLLLERTMHTLVMQLLDFNLLYILINWCQFSYIHAVILQSINQWCLSAVQICWVIHCNKGCALPEGKAGSTEEWPT